MCHFGLSSNQAEATEKNFRNYKTFFFAVKLCNEQLRALDFLLPGPVYVIWQLVDDKTRCLSSKYILWCYVVAVRKFTLFTSVSRSVCLTLMSLVQLLYILLRSNSFNRIKTRSKMEWSCH